MFYNYKLTQLEIQSMLESSGKIDLSDWKNIHVSEYDHFVNTIQALNKDDGKFRLKQSIYLYNIYSIQISAIVIAIGGGVLSS